MEKKKRLSLADRISQQNAVHTSEDERLNEQKIIASVSPDAIPGRSFADIVRASAKEYGHDKIMEKMRGMEAKAEANLARQQSEQVDKWTSGQADDSTSQQLDNPELDQGQVSSIKPGSGQGQVKVRSGIKYQVGPK